MKILYVEDNDDNIYMLRTRLTRGEHDDPTAVRTRERRGHAAALDTS